MNRLQLEHVVNDGVVLMEWKNSFALLPERLKDGSWAWLEPIQVHYYLTEAEALLSPYKPRMRVVYRND